MALEDLYGIGKGQAQIIDNRPMLDLLAEQRVVDRENNAKRIAKQAANKAAIENSANLKVDGFYKDIQYLLDEKNSIQTGMAKDFLKGGDDVYTNNPEKKAALDQRINHLAYLSQKSKSYSDLANDQMKFIASKNPEDLEPKSLSELNNWYALDPATRMVTEMPIVTTAMPSLEKITERDWKNEASNITKPFGYSGKKTAEGSVTDYEGEKIDKKKYDATIKSILTPGTAFYRKAKDEVTDEIDQNKIPLEINGEINPAYLDKFNEIMNEKATDNLDRLLKPEYTKSNRHDNVDGTGNKQEAPSLIVQDESKQTISSERPLMLNSYDIKSKDGKIIQKGKPIAISSNTYVDNDGNKYYKTNQNVYRTPNGRLSVNAEFISSNGVVIKNEPILAGTVIDVHGKEAPEGLKEITPIFKIDHYTNSGKTIAATGFGKHNLTGVKYRLANDGSLEQLSENEGFKGAEVSEVKLDYKYKIDGNKYVFEGDPKFDKLDKPEQKSDFAKIVTSNGISTIPLNKEVLGKNKGLSDIVEQVKAGGSQLSGEDKAAYDWATSNQNDPRAKEILKRLNK